MVCGSNLWFVSCGLWFVGCGLRFVVCGLRFVVSNLWFVGCGLWFPPETCKRALEAVSSLQFCWQAQDFQAFFTGKGAKVLVHAVFRACGSFRGLWPQTFRPQCSLSCHGAYQSIHAQTIITFVLREHTNYQSIHAQTIIPFRVSRAYDYQSIHAQTIITFVFRENTIARASMPKP